MGPQVRTGSMEMPALLYLDGSRQRRAPFRPVPAGTGPNFYPVRAYCKRKDLAIIQIYVLLTPSQGDTVDTVFRYMYMACYHQMPHVTV